jgi:purine-nucleoside phosphorylase
MLNKIKESIQSIRKVTNFTPEVGIILGTGLGNLGSEIIIENEISYKHIQHFPISTVESHAGNLIFGKLSNKNVVAMSGRFHLYEGYAMQDITLPVRVMKELGVKTLLVSNACGSVNTYFRRCDLMIIDDHINLMGTSPLIGKHYEEFGPRFVDLSQPYSQRLINFAEEIALEHHIAVKKGVYAAMSGPNLETRAEYKMLRIIGADVIGMSTIPEVIVANQIGLEVFAASIITDECYPDALTPLSVVEIIEAANLTVPKLTIIFRELIKRL